MDKYPPTTQRPVLLKFVEALGCRDIALRRDECGDWRINGKHGCIYAIPGGFQVFIMGWAAKGWNAAKKELPGRICNDGDEEGAIILDRLPMLDEAALIRHYAGIAKKMEFSPENLARHREWASTVAKLKGRRPALSPPEVD